jgi:polyisoprenoid-binding protein YceI
LRKQILEVFHVSVLEQQTAIPAGIYTADPTHSSVEFSIRHMGLATIRGRASDFAASLDARGDTPLLEGTIETASITTHDEQRDGHLGSPEFFDAQRHPRISFRSTGLELDGDHGTLSGELTVKGTSKPVQLGVVVTGAGEDPWGNQRVGLDLDGVIDRREFGIDWNAPLPGGGLLLDDRVRLTASFSLVRQG